MVIPEKEKFERHITKQAIALVATMMPDTDKVHKVTIIPRGRALGVTQMFPKETNSEQHLNNCLLNWRSSWVEEQAEELHIQRNYNGCSK